MPLQAREIVRHRDGWCAVRGGRRPAEGMTNVPTRCGMWVCLPFDYSRGIPTCSECRATRCVPMSDR